MLINRIYFLVFLLYFFAPIAYIPIIAMFLLVFSIFTTNKVEFLQRNLALSSLLFVFVSFVMIIINFQTGKEIVELYKWSIVTLLVLFFQKERAETFILAFQLFSILSFVMLIIQQFFPESQIIVKVSSFYASSELIEENFVEGYVRSTGFNEGPGHVGVLISFNLLIVYLKFKWGIISRFNRYASIPFSLVSIVITAAKGALPIFLLLNKKISLLLFGIISIIFFSIFSLEEIFYLERLTNSASGEARFDIWSSLINKSFSDPLTFLFGNARVDEIATITIFDSDWIYIFFTKGIFGVFLLLIILLQLSLCLQWSKKSTIFILILLILIGFANPAFTDIKFGIIYFYLLISLGYIRKNKINLNNNLIKKTYQLNN